MILDRKTLERFLSKVEIVESGCWIWTAGVDAKGYGQFTIKGKSWYRAHRVAYQHFKGIIFEGLVVDHLCRIRSCVNPDHLEAVTVQENIKRGNVGLRRKSITHCPYGHKYSKKNTKYEKNNSRKCKECIAIRQKPYQKEYYVKNKEKIQERHREYYKRKVNVN